MKLICPSCGAVAGAEAWERDQLARECLRAIVVLPPPVGASLLGYLSLFRPGKSSLSWKRALRLTREIARLVSSRYVTGVHGQVARPCSPTIWAAAMDEMSCRRDALSRPLGSHNYLREVAWGLAETADKQREMSAREREVSGGSRETTAPAGGKTVMPDWMLGEPGAQKNNP